MVVDAEGIRESWPHALAAIARWCGDITVAEDAVQEAVTRLLASGSEPDRIDAWLITTAKRVTIDDRRRRHGLDTRLPALANARPMVSPGPEEDSGVDPVELALGDDRLAMLLVACDPRLEPETRLALTLRFVLGVSTADIADVLLVSHPTMSARLTRAKKRIARDGLAEPGALRARLPDMLAALHSLFTLGHASPTGHHLGEDGTRTVAMDLARRLHVLVPDEPETGGLLALMLFVHARSATRDDPLEVADRRRWDRRAIREAMDLATAALPSRGRFALEAGIAGVHSTAPSWHDTDWTALVALYDRLVELWPSPSAVLARAVAVSHVPGRLARALEEIDAVVGAPARHVAASRADVLRRLERYDEARSEYRRAILLEGNAAARDWLRRRHDALPL
jgi:RNA polymerase sigma-70 factor (ECF subfamily)